MELYGVYALNAATGTKLWNYTTGFAVSSSPAVVNGVVYFGGSDGNLYAIGNAAAATSQAATSQAATGQGATPGFEVVFAFVGLVIAAYVVRRRS
jgi:PGF-CTERM protein